MNLCELIGNPRPAKRMAVLKAIGDGFDPDQRNAVERALASALLSDANAVVRHESAFLLASMAEQKLIAGGLGFRALCKAVNDKSVLVRHEVALSLAAFPGPETDGLLRRLLNDSAEDVAVSARLAIEQMQDVP